MRRLLLLTLVLGCSRRPSSAELDRWRADAVAKNAAMIVAHPPKVEAAWQVTIGGRVAKPLPLDVRALDARAKTIVRTRNPTNTVDTQVKSFRGVKLADLIDEAGALPEATEVTIVAKDAFRATFQLADLRKYPILLAIEQDGAPMAEVNGGPVSIVMPYTDYPALAELYPANWWCWYVTDVIVGTEPPVVRVGPKTLDAAALAKLEQVSIEVEVGYKVDWPSSKVKLSGVRLRDALHAAGVEIPPDGKVRVTGKAPIDHDPKRPTDLAAADVLTYEIILALRWGDDGQAIPAAKGGPITLAFPSECKANYPEKRWLTFVEDVEIAP